MKLQGGWWIDISWGSWKLQMRDGGGEWQGAGGIEFSPKHYTFRKSNKYTNKWIQLVVIWALSCATIGRVNTYLHEFNLVMDTIHNKIKNDMRKRFVLSSWPASINQILRKFLVYLNISFLFMWSHCFMVVLLILMHFMFCSFFSFEQEW